jgi:RNA polymerase sigma factor (sigma-70 family)
MENTVALPSRHGQGRYVVAMVLGTALSAFGPATGNAAPPDAAARAVNDLSRYCTACWRNARLHPDCWGDCTQEVLTRLLQRVEPDAWGDVLRQEGEERREFLRAIDAVKKRTQRQRRWAAGAPDAVPDRRDGVERRRAEDREAINRAAAEVLTARQQRILQMSFEGWSVQDLAAELQLPPERVSDEKYKAIRKLREHLRPANERHG